MLLRTAIINVQTFHGVAWRTCTMLRAFATGRGEQGARQAGVQFDRLKALPFSISLEQAGQSFIKHQTSNIFLAQAQSWEKLKETFMPFWLVRMDVQVTASSAKVGHRVMQQVGSGKDKRMEWHIHWQAAHAEYAAQRYYPAEDPDMQVFASSKYSRSDMNKLAPGPAVAGSVPITTPGVLESEGAGSSGAQLRRVVPFTMSAADARSFALAHVRQFEEQAAVEFYKSMFQADEAQVADLQIQVTHTATYPLYVPTYVFSRYHKRSPSLASAAASILGMQDAQKVKIHTFVSGSPPDKVAGTKVYDETRVAAAAMLLGPTLLWFSGAGIFMGGLGATILVGGALPAFVAATVARYLPELRASMAAMRNPGSGSAFLRGVRMALGLPSDDQQGAAGGRETLEDEWVRSYSAREARDEYEHQQQEFGARGKWSSFHRQKQQARMRDDSDPKGYYSMLGVSPSATTDEIQAAFRAAALNCHPDRPGGSTESFQKLQQAYSVLRDKNRRAEYDAGSWRA